jgi:hypothetical protein
VLNLDHREVSRWIEEQMEQLGGPTYLRAL